MEKSATGGQSNSMQLDEQRLKRQLGIVKKWIKHNGIGTLQAVTGFGKTMVAILLLTEMQEKFPSRKAIVVVPTLALKKQWSILLEKHNIHCVTDVVVVNTAIKKKWTTDLLIIDEIHNMAANTFSKIFDTVNYRFILGLTATLERTDQKHVLIEKKAPIFATVTLKEAQENGWISEYIVYNLAVQLSEEDALEISKLDRDFQKYFSWFGHDFDKVKYCLNKDYAERYALDINQPAKMIIIYARQVMNIVRKRKEILYDCESKVATAIQLIHRFQDKRIITYSYATSTADKLTAMLGKEGVSYHSGMRTKARAESLERFRNKRYKARVLNTAKALDEGFDESSASVAIILSGDSSKRRNIQRMGRVLRMMQGKKAIIINLYVQGTQDERWLRNRQKGTASNAYWVKDISQVNLDAPVPVDREEYLLLTQGK